MAKYIYLQDSHIKGKNSTFRIGNYYSDMLLKIQEVIDLSVEKKVDAVIHGGDLFNGNMVSTVMIDDIVDRIEKAKIPWKIVWGNHDQINHSSDLSNASALAHIFRRSKFISHLEEIKDNKSIIKGFDYYHNIEEDIKEKGLYYSDKTKKWKIAIVHAFITEKPFLPQVMHIPIQDISSDYDVILVSHNHQQFGIKTKGKTKYINIGCLGRQSIQEAKTTPQVLFIDTDKQEIYPIILKTAKPKEEVFDLEKVEEIKKYEKDIDNFIESLNSAKVEGLNLRGLVESICREKNENKEVTDCIIKRISKYEDENK